MYNKNLPYAKIDNNRMSFDVSLKVSDMTEDNLMKTYTSLCLHIKTAIDRHLKSVDLTDGPEWWIDV